jgi:predicted transcriptional regulator
MLERTIQLFTDKEEEFVNLLVEIGTRKNIAKMLVYLANTKEATSRDMELGADMRQPEVSTAVKELASLGWIKERKIPSENKGRMIRKFSLSVPVKEIIATIEMQKKSEAGNQLALVRKVRSFA